MNRFKALFGIDSSKVGKNCILIPYVPKSILKVFKINKPAQGKLYSSAVTDSFTIIQTKVGAGFAGDAVLHLKETECRSIILFGVCGLVKERQGITLGSLVAPSKCYPMESFSQWLLKRELTSTYSTPQKDFYNNFLQKNREEQISTVSCCTVSSLVLEEERHEDLIYKGIDVVDMECSAFFTGAESVNLKALALFFISDIIGKKPFYLSLSIKDKLTILNAGKRAAKLIYRYFKGF